VRRGYQYFGILTLSLDEKLKWPIFHNLFIFNQAISRIYYFLNLRKLGRESPTNAGPECVTSVQSDKACPGSHLRSLASLLTSWQNLVVKTTHAHLAPSPSARVMKAQSLISSPRSLYVLSVTCMCCLSLVCAVSHLYVLSVTCMCCHLYVLSVTCMCCLSPVCAVCHLYVLTVTCMCCLSLQRRNATYTSFDRTANELSGSTVSVFE
jgi:hypothetical protein